MQCPKCGREIPDGTLCPCSYGQPMLSDNPAVNAIKLSGSSGLFLAAAVLYSIAVLLMIFSSVAGPSSTDATLYVLNLLESMGVEFNPAVAYQLAAASASDSTDIFAALWSSVTSILIAVGMWLHYATCRNVRTGNISTAGLTINKVLAVIELVCVSIAMAGVALFTVLSIGAAGRTYREGSDAAMEIAFLFLICLALLVLVVCYLAGLVRLINRLKASATYGTPDHRISRFVTAMLWISGIFSAFVGLADLFVSPLGGLSSLASAACTILVAVLLGRLRRQMTVLMYPPAQPAYVSQPSTPSGENSKK